MEAEINGLTASLRNATDAQSAVDTGEQALAEVHTLLLRMRELAAVLLVKHQLLLIALHLTLK